nr:hypothetical protein [uncultured Nocardioides sp.]
MSVDTRVRLGLEDVGTALPPVDIDVALARTLGRGRRSRTRRRVTGVLAAAAGVAALTVAVAQYGGGPNTAPPVVEPPPDRAAPKTTVLDGTWRTEPLSFSDLAAHLREEGLGDWVDELRDETGRFSGVRAQMTLRGEEMDFLIRGHTEDNWRFSVEGDRLAFVNMTGMLISVFDVSLDDNGRTMSLRLETPSTGSWHGIPHEVYHTAYFTTVSFERVD